MKTAVVPCQLYQQGKGMTMLMPAKVHQARHMQSCSVTQTGVHPHLTRCNSFNSSKADLTAWRVTLRDLRTACIQGSSCSWRTVTLRKVCGSCHLRLRCTMLMKLSKSNATMPCAPENLQTTHAKVMHVCIVRCFLNFEQTAYVSTKVSKDTQRACFHD